MEELKNENEWIGRQASNARIEILTVRQLLEGSETDRLHERRDKLAVVRRMIDLSKQKSDIQKELETFQEKDADESSDYLRLYEKHEEALDKIRILRESCATENERAQKEYIDDLCRIKVDYESGMQRFQDESHRLKKSLNDLKVSRHGEGETLSNIEDIKSDFPEIVDRLSKEGLVDENSTGKQVVINLFSEYKRLFDEIKKNMDLSFDDQTKVLEKENKDLKKTVNEKENSIIEQDKQSQIKENLLKSKIDDLLAEKKKAVVEKENSKDESESLKEEVEIVKIRLQKNKETLSMRTGQLTVAQENINNINEELKMLEAQHDSAKRQLAVKDAEILRLRQDLDDEKERRMGVQTHATELEESLTEMKRFNQTSANSRSQQLYDDNATLVTSLQQKVDDSQQELLTKARDDKVKTVELRNIQEKSNEQKNVIERQESVIMSLQQQNAEFESCSKEKEQREISTASRVDHTEETGRVHQELVEEIDDKQGIILGFKTKLEDAELTNKTKTELVEHLTEEVDNLQQIIEDLNSKLHNYELLNKDETDHKQLSEEMNSQQETIQDLNRKLEIKEKACSEAELANKTKTEYVEHSTVEIDNLQQIIKDLNSKLDNNKLLNKDKTDHKHLSEEMNSQQKIIQDLNNKLEIKEKACTDAELANKTKTERVDYLTVEINNLQQIIEDLNSKLDNNKLLNKDETDHKQLSEEMNSQQEIIKDLNSKLEMKEKACSEAELTNKTKTERVEHSTVEIDNLQQIIKDLNSQLDNYELLNKDETDHKQLQETIQNLNNKLETKEKSYLHQDKERQIELNDMSEKLEAKSEFCRKQIKTIEEQQLKIEDLNKQLKPRKSVILEDVQSVMIQPVHSYLEEDVIVPQNESRQHSHPPPSIEEDLIIPVVHGMEESAIGGGFAGDSSPLITGEIEWIMLNTPGQQSSKSSMKTSPLPLQSGQKNNKPGVPSDVKGKQPGELLAETSENMMRRSPEIRSEDITRNSSRAIPGENDTRKSREENEALHRQNIQKLENENVEKDRKLEELSRLVEEQTSEKNLLSGRLQEQSSERELLSTKLQTLQLEKQESNREKACQEEEVGNSETMHCLRVLVADNEAYAKCIADQQNFIASLKDDNVELRRKLNDTLYSYEEEFANSVRVKAKLKSVMNKTNSSTSNDNIHHLSVQYKQEIESLKRQIEDVRSERQRLKHELEEKSYELDKTQSDLSTMKGAIEYNLETERRSKEFIEEQLKLVVQDRGHTIIKLKSTELANKILQNKLRELQKWHNDLELKLINNSNDYERFTTKTIEIDGDF